MLIKALHFTEQQKTCLFPLNLSVPFVMVYVVLYSVVIQELVESGVKKKVLFKYIFVHYYGRRKHKKLADKRHCQGKKIK